MRTYENIKISYIIKPNTIRRAKHFDQLTAYEIVDEVEKLKSKGYRVVAITIDGMRLGDYINEMVEAKTMGGY